MRNLGLRTLRPRLDSNRLYQRTRVPWIETPRSKTKVSGVRRRNANRQQFVLAEAFIELRLRLLPERFDELDAANQSGNPRIPGRNKFIQSINRIVIN